MTTISPASRYILDRLSAAAAKSDSVLSDFSTYQDAENKSGKDEANITDAGVQASSVNRPSTVTVKFQGQLFNLTGTLTRLADNPSLRPISIGEMSEELYEMLTSAPEAMLKQQYTRIEVPDLPDYQGTKAYATVVVAGKVIATIDNQGVVGSSDAIAARLEGKLPDSSRNGPDIAQARAEAIAALIGGRIVKEPTAITQKQFDALPSMEPKITLDYDAMIKDPEYQRIQEMKQNRMSYLAQQEANSSARL